MLFWLKEADQLVFSDLRTTHIVKVHEDAKGDLVVFHTQGLASFGELNATESDAEARELMQEERERTVTHRITKDGWKERI